MKTTTLLIFTTNLKTLPTFFFQPITTERVRGADDDFLLPVPLLPPPHLLRPPQPHRAANEIGRGDFPPRLPHVIHAGGHFRLPHVLQSVLLLLTKKIQIK